MHILFKNRLYVYKLMILMRCSIAVGGVAVLLNGIN
jgi:hypothetical protein